MIFFSIEKNTIIGRSFIFEEGVKILALQGGLLKTITEHKYIEPISSNSQLLLDFSNVMKLDQHALR